jgi:hypothetical protein
MIALANIDSAFRELNISWRAAETQLQETLASSVSLAFGVQFEKPSTVSVFDMIGDNIDPTKQSSDFCIAIKLSNFGTIGDLLNATIRDEHATTKYVDFFGIYRFTISGLEGRSVQSCMICKALHINRMFSYIAQILFGTNRVKKATMNALSNSAMRMLYLAIRVRCITMNYLEIQGLVVTNALAERGEFDKSIIFVHRGTSQESFLAA